MIKHAVRFAICLLLIALSVLSAVAGDVFVTSRLETRAGYENNRLEEPGSGQGTPFWQATPGFEITAFSEKTETSLLLHYRRTQYTESGFEFKDEVSAFTQWRYFGGRNEVGASVGGKLYRDKALPADDCASWHARPYVVRTLGGLPAELSLAATFRQTFYDTSVYASTADRADSCWDVRPGLRYHLSRQVTVWAELYGEGNESDALEAEYSGLGGVVGCDVRPAARLDVGAWARTGTRRYDGKVEGEDRSDTPSRVGAWATYRPRPWMELFSSVDWESFASTIDDSEYSWWQVGGGVRFVFERELRGR